jgi:hypothetical protein
MLGVGTARLFIRVRCSINRAPAGMMMAQPEDVYQLSGMIGYPEVGPTVWFWSASSFCDRRGFALELNPER